MVTGWWWNGLVAKIRQFLIYKRFSKQNKWNAYREIFLQKAEASLKDENLKWMVSVAAVLFNQQWEKCCDGREPHLSWHSTLPLHWSVWPTSNLRVYERHFFPISSCLIHPQHLSPHQRGQRQQSQHYPKQPAEPATGFCHLLAVTKTGQIKNMFPLAPFTWKIISSQFTSKKWPGKGSRKEIWWQIDRHGQLSLWWSIILDGSSISNTRIFYAQTHKSQAFILCQ